MLKNSSSQEPIGQFQPHMIRNLLGELGFRFFHIKGLALLGPNKGQNKEKFDKFSKMLSRMAAPNWTIFSMDHRSL